MIEKILQKFVEEARETGLPLEAIAVGDESKVIFEHHFVPDQPRNIYSHTKSFMSTAAGIAIAEGKLSLEDRPADFFEDKLPSNPSPRLLSIRLKDLLTMSSGFGKGLLMGADRRAGTGVPDYVSYLFSQEVIEEPGTRFHYSTGDSILAGRMVEEASGMRLSEYLYRRIFAPMEIGFPIWENDPMGHPIGGGGMFLKLTDMMKLGQLYLAGGVWKGQRLVEESWIREATKEQIKTDQDPQNPDIWRCGYGYQFWLSPYPDSYRADGAFGQITTVLPRAGLVVSIQCPETGDFERVKQALHESVLDKL